MESHHPSKDIYRNLVELVDHGRPCLLAVVLQAGGSTPCKAGAKVIMDAHGVLQGTIGGGSVEARAEQLAAETIKSGRPVLLDFNLEGCALGDADPICGGAMRVLIDPLVARHREAFAAAAAMQRSRGRGVLLTTVSGRAPWDVVVECLAEEAIGARDGFPGAEAVRATLQHEQPRLFSGKPAAEGRRLEVLVEPLLPRPMLLVIGGGHVGQAVTAQAALVGFDVVVIDDRPEFTRRELFPGGVAMRCGNVAEELSRFPLAEGTYIVIVTRGHQHDAEALAACLHRPAAYIGLIGSQRKVAMMRKAFVESGRATDAEFDRVYAPIGLDLGSVTVPEIATSIVAQLIAVRRRGSAPRIATRPTR